MVKQQQNSKASTTAAALQLLRSGLMLADDDNWMERTYKNLRMKVELLLNSIEFLQSLWQSWILGSLFVRHGFWSTSGSLAKNSVFFFGGDGKARTSSMKKNLGCGFMVSLVQSAAGQKGFFGTESGLEGDTLAGRMFGTVVWFSGKNMLHKFFSMTCSVIGYPWLTTENRLKVKYEFSMACFLCLNIIWMAFELQVYGTFAGEELALLPAVDEWRRKIQLVYRNLRRMKAISTFMKISLFRPCFFSISTPSSRRQRLMDGRTWRPHRLCNATSMAGQHVSGNFCLPKNADFFRRFWGFVRGEGHRWFWLVLLAASKLHGSV